MGRNYCAIKDCHNYLNKIGRFGKPVKLHNLPKEPYLRKAWMIAISRKDFSPKRTFVCSDHFPNGDGRTWRHKVPSLFLPQKKTKSVVKRTSKNSCKNSADPGLFVEHVQHDVGTFHTYAKDTKASVSCTGPSMLAVDQNIQFKLSSVDESTISDRPEITIEDIQSSDTQIQFYTGLPDFSTFMALFDCLIEHGADKIIIDNNLRTATGKRKLRLVDEFLMVMMRLRLGLLLKDLEYRFRISASRISRIFSAWITFICKCLQSINQLSKSEVEQTRRIASARIHVERKMEQIKNFRILQGILPLSLGHIVDEIFFICAALTNLLPPLVKFIYSSESYTICSDVSTSTEQITFKSDTTSLLF
ncbi:hypothetical protein KUTeg_007830 [Tegillarca granosa]|uniref:THAP-type domain-containing protein n=1 Tax=Tegillarca granosa TaxID=220873 RepID=A0ABQ9FEE4_TEGGR|nr:hypothetical protein KUTeg_007830 [Tegillarca granosa]